MEISRTEKFLVYFYDEVAQIFLVVEFVFSLKIQNVLSQESLDLAVFTFSGDFAKNFSDQILINLRVKMQKISIPQMFLEQIPHNVPVIFRVIFSNQKKKLLLLE